MIHINLARIHIPVAWEKHAKLLTAELLTKKPAERAAFILSKRDETWGHDDLLNALRSVVGNKCWYSEVPLEGADPNVDHFRPKGRVVEVDCDTFIKTGIVTSGYWWLAFDPSNYRLSSIHSNQRRVDKDTAGGKWDFFPVDGARSPEGTKWALISEVSLPLDPCSASDMSLMWFGPDGTPGFTGWRRKPNPLELRRLNVTIWLFHLNKHEISKRRSQYIQEVRADLKSADTQYTLWNPFGNSPDLIAKGQFDSIISRMKNQIADDAPFAGAKRCAVQLARSEFLWIDDFL